MSKGLEALHRIANANNHFKYDTLELMDKDFQIVQQELLRLEAIENANPSEALEYLEQLVEMADKCWVSCDVHKWKNTINKALLKSQEQEKVLEIICEKGVDVGYLKTCETLEEYNSNCWNDEEDFNKSLTQEEFDLLKRYFK